MTEDGGPKLRGEVEQANAARMYDFLLGGGHNFEVDRARAREAIAANPHLPAAARANRAFLFRVVNWCLDRGIDQFLDLGSGVPTVGNVHEVAHRRNPAARVAYVDVEPVAVAHSRQLLADTPGATITHADLRHPGTVLAAPGVAGLLDFTRPVALLTVAVLHFVPDDPAAVLTAYREVLAPGSIVALSHGSEDHDDPELDERIRIGTLAYRTSTTPITPRSRAQLHELMAGLDLVEPGLVDVTDWPTPTPDTPVAGFYGCVGEVR